MDGIRSTTSVKASRVELIKWINEILQVNITSIDRVYNGAINCQIMHMLYPNSIPMSKVNFSANDVFECQKNYRLLQTAFSKRAIPYNLEIDKLSKGRPQDNLELIQFMKDLFARVYDGHEYNPILARERSKGGKSWNHHRTNVNAMNGEFGYAPVMESPALRPAAYEAPVQYQKPSSYTPSETIPEPTPTQTREDSILPLPQQPDLPTNLPVYTQPETTGYGDIAMPPLSPQLEHLQSYVPSQRKSSSVSSNKMRRLSGASVSEVKALNSRVDTLKECVKERDRFIEHLRKEGISMYHTLRKVEEYLLEAKEQGIESIEVDVVLNLMYNNFQVENPDEEEKWASEGLTIENVDDSLEGF